MNELAFAKVKCRFLMGMGVGSGKGNLDSSGVRSSI